jgi:hypothetical protein
VDRQRPREGKAAREHAEPRAPRAAGGARRPRRLQRGAAVRRGPAAGASAGGPASAARASGRRTRWRTRRGPAGAGHRLPHHPDGYALTNHHVVEGATRIQVRVGRTEVRRPTSSAATPHRRRPHQARRPNPAGGPWAPLPLGTATPSRWATSSSPSATRSGCRSRCRWASCRRRAAATSRRRGARASTTSCRPTPPSTPATPVARC